MSPVRTAQQTTRKVLVAGATVNLYEWGEGLPILLLHGNPDSGIMWEGVASISERGNFALRLICPASDIQKYQTTTILRSMEWRGSSNNFDKPLISSDRST